jgi:hypothetical protein
VGRTLDGVPFDRLFGERPKGGAGNDLYPDGLFVVRCSLFVSLLVMFRWLDVRGSACIARFFPFPYPFPFFLSRHRSLDRR